MREYKRALVEVECFVYIYIYTNIREHIRELILGNENYQRQKQILIVLIPKN